MILWQRLSAGLRSHHVTRLVVLSVLVGVVAGVGALAFNLVLDTSNEVFLHRIVGYELPKPGGEGATVMPEPPQRRWLLLIVPALGGLLSGLLVFTFAPEAEGHGTDAMIDSYHRKGGVIRKRIPFLKTLASALTIGTGGSAGREGPIAQVGAGFGSALGGWLKASDRERRILLLAGAGAGIGAVFRAPLGGAIFASEVLYREMEFESAALVPTFIASIISYSIYSGVTGKWGAIFAVPPLQFNHPLELPLYVLLGVACAGMGILYVKSFYGTRDWVFRRLPVPRHIKPMLGGLAVGGLGYFLPQVLSMGYGWVQLAMDGQLPLTLILIVAFAKIAATSLTISSGGSGGVFAPSMVIGGLLGAAFGIVGQRLLPGIVMQPAAFALVGMAGFFAGAAKTPVSSLIMVSEMTKGYGLLAPLMLTTTVSYLLTPRRISLYEHQVNRRADSPAHEGEFVTDILERIQVADAMPRAATPTVLRRDAPLPEILEMVAGSQQHVFPVVNPDGTLAGVIYFDDIRIFFTERGLPARAVVAQDLLANEITTIAREEDLSAALRKFRIAGREELPVVSITDPQRIVGVLSRHHILAAYHDRVPSSRPPSTPTSTGS